jgi:uncharacterized protein (DUF433 family)
MASQFSGKTHIAATPVLKELAHNPGIDERLATNPDLTRTEVQACLVYAKVTATGEDMSVRSTN